MPDLLSVIQKWWRSLVVFILATTAITAAIVWLQPKEYLATVTALPATSISSDKARIFNNNIEHLYSAYGSTDELDRYLGTARLDTLYLQMAEELHLQKHFRIKGTYALQKAARELKSKIKLERTEYGELKVHAWDRDPLMAATLANRFTALMQDLHGSLQNQNNLLIVQALRKKLAALPPASGNDFPQLEIDSSGINHSVPYDQAKLRQLLSEYELTLNTNPPVLLVIEPARPPIKADRPKRMATVFIALCASAIFGLLLALFLDSRNRKHVPGAV